MKHLEHNSNNGVRDVAARISANLMLSVAHNLLRGGQGVHLVQVETAAGLSRMVKYHMDACRIKSYDTNPATTVRACDGTRLESPTYKLE